MKTNTFYNPKNQYNELLASVKYVNAEDSALDKKFTDEIARVDGRIDTEAESRDAADNAIHHKIDTFNTIKVKWINADRGDNKWSNIKDYFRSLLEPTAATSVDHEALKVELGQTIYIIEGKDDANTWEEWVCQYPNFDQNHEDYEGCKIPVMIRLGAVDSILATTDAPGSVRLTHNLYNEEDWSKYFATDYEGNISHKPIKGEAVAPCALKAFIDADKSIAETLENEIIARKEAITAEETIRAEEDKSIKDRLDKIEEEIEGSTVQDDIGFQGSRLDRIEAAIGINHQHCDNCGCEHDSCSCSDATNKCTIYCRLNDAESDLQEHMNILEEHNERITNLEELTSAHTTDISNLQTEDGLIRTLIEEEAERLENLISGNTRRIETVETNIESISTELSEESARAKAAEAQIDKKLDEKIKKCEDADDAFRAEIGEKTLPADGTVWSEIKNIQSTIGVQDAPHEDTIWVRINNNKKELHDKIDGEISRSKEVDEDHGSRISVLETDIEDIETEIGTKGPTDIDIWYSIHTEINNRVSADKALSNDIADMLASAKTYADELKTVTLSEAAVDAEKKTAVAEANAISSAAADASEKVEKAKEETINYAEDFTNNAISEAAKTLRAEISDTKDTCKEYTDSVADLKLNEAKDYADNAKDAATATAANDATIKVEAAKTAAITTATENSKQYIDNEVEKLKDLCNDYTDNKTANLSSTLSRDITTAKEEAINTAKDDAATKKQEAIEVANQNIELAKERLSSTIDSKVSNDVFESYSQRVETTLETKASSNDLAKTDNKLTTVEKDLEDISHELHHLTSQTQFAVRTSIPGAGVKTIQFYNLVGPASNEWDLIRITSVIANNETIYPEIEYSGELTDEKNDERKVEITFEHGGDENLPVTLIISAFKASEYRIIEID